MIIKSENSIAASTRMPHTTIRCDKHIRLSTTQKIMCAIPCRIMHDCMLDLGQVGKFVLRAEELRGALQNFGARM